MNNRRRRRRNGGGRGEEEAAEDNKRCCWIVDTGSATLRAWSAASQRLFCTDNAILYDRHGKGHFSDTLSCKNDMHWKWPCEQEYVTDFHAQTLLWGHAADTLGVTTRGSRLVLTVPPHSFKEYEDQLYAYAFEVLECSHVAIMPTRALLPALVVDGTGVFVDMGFSATHVFAAYNRDYIARSHLRLEVCGRIITNHMTDLISYRHVAISPHFSVAEEMKRKISKAVPDLQTALKEAAQASVPPADNPHIVDYVLPDFVASVEGRVLERGEMTLEDPKTRFMRRKRAKLLLKQRGAQRSVLCSEALDVPRDAMDKGTMTPHYSASTGTSDHHHVSDIAALGKQKSADITANEDDDCQIIRLTNETFTPAEAYFNPADIGIDSLGLCECIAECIQRCPEWLKPALTQKIYLCGGNALIPGMIDRIQRDLPPLLSDIPEHSFGKDGTSDGLMVTLLQPADKAAITSAIASLAQGTLPFRRKKEVFPPPSAE